MELSNLKTIKKYGDYIYEFGVRETKEEPFSVYAKVTHNGKEKYIDQYYDDFGYARKSYYEIVRDKDFNEMVAFASKLVFEKQAEQLDLGFNSYLFHTFTVRDSLEDPIQKTVGVLHDIVEDTDVTIKEIEDYFPKEVSEAVDAITRIKSEKFKESDEDYYARIVKNRTAILVKIQDLMHNLEPRRLGKLVPSIEDANRIIKYANHLKYLIEVYNK